MGLIDFILNLAGVLLWISGCSAPPKAPVASIQKPLLATLRQASFDERGRRNYLLLLPVLLVLRAVVYWWIGPAVKWVPQLEVGVLTVPFRSDRFGLMLLFSALSWLLTLAVFYLWMLLLSAVNSRVSDSDSLMRLVRSVLGRVERLPAFLRLLLIVPVVTLCWFALSRWLTRLGLLPPTVSTVHAWQQAVVVGAASLLSWKYLLVGVLLLYLLHCYIYFGSAPFWVSLELTGRNLLAPVRWLPLRIGRVDLAPLAGMALVFLVCERGEHWLTSLYQRLPW